MTITPSAAAVDAATVNKALRATFDSGRTRSVAWRQAQLAGLRRMLDEADAELTEALRQDLGRPSMEAYAADLGHARGELRHLAKHVGRWMKPRRVRMPATVLPARGWVQPEPLGVALVIAPWNYPIQLLVEPLAAALAAGNCVVAKPSELAPACSAALARLLPRYVDPDAVAVVEGGVAETTALLAQRWDHIFFTGSTAVGRIVAEAAAKHLTPTVLELGGKSPTYVHSSADLDVAARRIAWGKFLNAGQTCIAPDYVLADSSVRDALVDRLAEQIGAFYGTDPQRSESFGRIVNGRHLERLQGLLDKGAGTIAAGGTVDPGDRYVAPTITVDPSPEAPVMQEEIFGPILPVLAVDGPAAARDFITAREKPLALYVFAQDDAAVDVLVDGTSSGGVCINQTLMHLLPPDLPFGGVGDSGMGAYHGQAGFDVFSHLKSVLRKPTRPDVKLLYPPYRPTVEKLVRKLVR
ncbi:MAG TPA: aldehyde dehydrogenase family protein [Acidimicrobiales bacterium]|nr:aldehyde dehydrogenase family protein [Acidimicrobiales bacterium]